MGFLTYFLSDVYRCPVTTIYLLILLYFRTKLILHHWEISRFNVTYVECVTKRRLYRVFSSLFCHSSNLHALFDIVTFWNLRIVEKVYGSFFYLKYSILMVIFGTFLVLYLLDWIFKRSYSGDISRNPISSVEIFGSTGLIISWLGFLSIDLVMRKKYLDFYLFGIIPIPISITPIVVLLISQMWSPRSQSLSQSGGLAAGYLLAFRLLKILESDYWTYCFFMDVIIICFWYKIFPVTVPLSNPRPSNENNEDSGNQILEVANLSSYQYQQNNAEAIGSNENLVNRNNGSVTTADRYSVRGEDSNASRSTMTSSPTVMAWLNDSASRIWTSINNNSLSNREVPHNRTNGQYSLINRSDEEEERGHQMV